MTLTAIKCAPNGDCFIRYQDPNNPTVNQNYAKVTANGGRLQFAFNDPRAGTVFIYSAFAESAVPEPSSLILFGTAIAAALIGTRMLRVRKACNSPEPDEG